MKKYTYIYIAASLMCLFISLTAAAQGTNSITVANPAMTRNAELMTVSMDMNLSGLAPNSNRAVVFVPVIVNGEKEQQLPAVGIYGRTRWYQYIRSGGAPLGGYGELSFRASEQPERLEYIQNIPYEEWMNGAHLELRSRECGCCGTVLASSGEGVSLGGYSRYEPVFHWVKPVAEQVKEYELTARAYIDYPVDRTEINPAYSNNRKELERITATIDSLRGDRDITVASLTIKGFASPEGDYAHNEFLARSRTEALRSYVTMQLRAFSDVRISTSYEPEDWAGLREYVAGSDLTHKYAILRIIDDPTLDIDARERYIQSRFADDYAFLLNEVYPTLRRAEYSIVYTVRKFSDVATIRRMMVESPHKLSLSELYLLAQTMEPGSDEFNEVFETAVRLFPDDETANLNAANAAMSAGNLRRAERYLQKAGSSSEADYARGVLEELKNMK